MKHILWILFLVSSSLSMEFSEDSYFSAETPSDESDLFIYEKGSTRPNCEFAFYPGYSNVSICSLTYQQQNSWWLPEAYIYNANCACSTIPTDSNTANCIRQFLVFRMNDQSRYNTTFKNKLADMKKEYNEHKATHAAIYKEYIVKHLTPMIYQDHHDAYDKCCCKGTPAFYAAWEAVTTVKMPTCTSVKDSIQLFGSCSKHPGRW